MNPQMNPQINPQMNGMAGMGMSVGMNMMGQMGAMGMMMPQLFTFQPTWTSSNGVTHLNVTTVGAKTQASSPLCFILTVCLGGCLIFPLFFMCCMWWHSLVNPKY